MNCDTNFYLCKNLLFLDTNITHDYICTITGSKCNCSVSDTLCGSFEEEVEE